MLIKQSQTLLLAIILLTQISAFHISSQNIPTPQIHRQPSQQCNPTYFQWQNLNKLLNNSFMQLTFDPISQNLNGNQFTTADHVTYKIYPQTQTFPTRFYFNKTNQTLSFVQNDEILFEGGKVNFEILFQWSRNDSINQLSGVGKALGVTRQIPYVIRDSQNSSKFILSQVFNFTVSQLKIDWLNCTNSKNCIVTDDTKDAIRYLLTVKKEDSIEVMLEQRVNEWLTERLQFIVCCNNTESLERFDYVWQGSARNKSFTINRNYRNSYIQETGKLAGYYHSGDLSIENSNFTKCNTWPADTPFYGFGGSQEFISQTFMEVLLTNAIQSGVLNAIVNRTTFSNQYFNFTAGEVSNFISNIKQTFNDQEAIYGNCSAQIFTYVQPSYNSNSIMVQTSHQCQFFIQQTKIISFKLTYQVFLKVSVAEQSNLIDFTVGSIYISSTNPSFNDSFGFKVTDAQNLKRMVQNVVKTTMMNKKVLGSGWPMFLKRTEPVVRVLSFSVMIYDKAVPFN